jgi:hypothetical protein
MFLPGDFAKITSFRMQARSAAGLENRLGSFPMPVLDRGNLVDRALVSTFRGSGTRFALSGSL